MFKSLLSVILAGSAVNAHAALDFTQSSPSIKWHSISNEAVRVIYPDVLGAESIYVANLVEHYSHFVGQTYGIKKPQKFDLVIRPEMSQPNGFVALAPRRSEWFASSMYMPLVGSTEWYQTLAIHEYRHVNQFDFYNRDASQILYYLMGDMGRNLSVFLALPSWYFEGDAVWAETKYTDGGRGRSPRFMARLKALVLSDKLPTYDQFLNGSYQTNLPNQYVYGYALISYATKKYGEDIWEKIINDVSKFPQPFRLYDSFKEMTGQEFKDFYFEAMNDLRVKWAKDAPGVEETVDYREASAPFKVGKVLYYVESTMNSYPTLVKEENGHKEKIVEFYYNKDILGLSVGNTRAIYTEYLPDARYAYKGSSDLVVVDLKTGSTDKLTSGERLYNPSFNRSETKIIATSFNPDQSWTIVEYDLQGKLLQSLSIGDSKVAEARYIDDRHAAVLLNSKTGHKSIVVVDLDTKKIAKVVLPPSRNLLNSLYVDQNKNLLFEAQYKGGNEVFSFNGEGVARCTKTKLGAFTPSSDGATLYYSNMDTYGSMIASQSLKDCQPLAPSELVDFKYLGDGPSDNYNNFPVQPLNTQEELFTKNASQYHPEEYGDIDERLFIPHTWGLNIGRGGGLIVQTDNYLHTMGLTAQAGSNAEEEASFFNLGLDYKKYYPIFRIETEYRGRRVKDFDTGTEVKWGEMNSGLSMYVPYIKKSGLYNFVTLLSVGAQYTNTNDYKVNDVKYDFANYFYKTNGQFLLSWGKDPKARSIIDPWLLSYRIRFDNADQPSDDRYDGYRVYQQGILQTPGLFANDGLQFTFDLQKQEGGVNAYRFQPETGVVGSYTFSRGYSFTDTPGYQKLSGNYVFPMMYPDWDLGNWYYLRRVYGNVFFDSTAVTGNISQATLNSYGAEMQFESKFFRIIPMTFGVRILQRLLDDSVRGEAFLSSSLAF
ncbi:MAG: hypothetical protein ACKOX6_00640 [Bdellovibrio sp.]